MASKRVLGCQVVMQIIVLKSSYLLAIIAEVAWLGCMVLHISCLGASSVPSTCRDHLTSTWTDHEVRRGLNLEHRILATEEIRFLRSPNVLANPLDPVTELIDTAIPFP
jgi:hypothetical protein